MPEQQVKCFTVRAEGRLRVLHTKVHVANPLAAKPGGLFRFDREYSGIWDTGATSTVITQCVVDDLGLKPISMTSVSTASGKTQAEVYVITLRLPNSVVIKDLPVTKGDLGESPHHMLIGMDVIGQGDFAVTNCQGKTMFSFRMPSQEQLDFCKPAHKTLPARAVPTVGRNDKCPCGSGRKYKQCHGKEA